MYMISGNQWDSTAFHCIRRNEVCGEGIKRCSQVKSFYFILLKVPRPYVLLCCSLSLFIKISKWISFYTCIKYLLKSLSLLHDLNVNKFWVLFFDRIARNPWKNPGVAWKMYKKAVSRQFGSKKRKSENAVSVYQPNISKLKLHHSLHNTLEVRLKTNDLANYPT